MNIIPWPYSFSTFEPDISQMTALPGGWDWYSIQSLGDELIAFGENGTQFCIASLDSPTGSWTLGTASSDADLLAALPDKCARLGTLYAVRVDTDKVATCTSLGAWTVSAHDLPVAPGSPFYFGLGTDASYFYITGMHSSGGWHIMLLRSANAVNWTLLDTQASPNWQTINAPVEFDGNIHVPVNTIGLGPWPDPYFVFDRGATNLVQAVHEFAHGDPFDESNGQSAIVIADGSLLYAGVTPGNASGLYLLKNAGAAPHRVGYAYAFGPTQYTASGFGGISGLKVLFQYGVSPSLSADLLVRDAATGAMFAYDENDLPAVVFAPLEAEHTAGSVTQDNWFVGPLNGDTVIQVIDGTTAERRLYTMPDVTLPSDEPEVNITELPTTVTGIVLNTLYGFNDSGEDYEATALGQAMYRANAVVFTVDVPADASAIRLEFQDGFDPDGYIDIFAAQGGSYATLSENYSADYYNYFYADEPGLRVQMIPVVGTTPLVIVVQGWSIFPAGGGLNITFSAQSFWADLTNCIESNV